MTVERWTNEPSDVGCYEEGAHDAGLWRLLQIRWAALTESGENDSPGRFGGSGTDRPVYLPRLTREYYQGDAVMHWTLPVSCREQGWLDERFHAAFRELMLHTAAREGLSCPTYRLMPDHLHLVWMLLRRGVEAQKI